MICELIAHTVITNHRAMADAGYNFHLGNKEVGYVRDPDELAEFAGRGCYESWLRPNPETATNQGYLRHILDVAHTSVLEHATATFYVAGVSRSLLMEFRTHRHLSFSALSQRYVNSENAVAIIPPALGGDLELSKVIGAHQLASQEIYQALVAKLTEKGLPRKQAREAARSVLPNATETRFVVSGNLWAWHYVLSRRLDAGADVEIRQLATKILAQLKEIAPNTFQDLS